MRMLACTATCLATLLTSSTVDAREPLNVAVDGWEDSAPIDKAYAACQPRDDGKSMPGDNQRPTISWSGAPAGTQSFAVFIVDYDVPQDFSNAGKEGKVVAADAPRKAFYHWAVVDIPAEASVLTGGPASESAGVGKPLTNDMGANKYVPLPTQYGGPCPPWNDERVHNYHVMVLALDVPSLKLDKNATAAQAMAAIRGGEKPLGEAKHVLASGVLVGTYSLNQALSE